MRTDPKPGRYLLSLIRRRTSASSDALEALSDREAGLRLAALLAQASTSTARASPAIGAPTFEPTFDAIDAARRAAFILHRAALTEEAR
jgi:hypothetical protein